MGIFSVEIQGETWKGSYASRPYTVLWFPGLWAFKQKKACGWPTIVCWKWTTNSNRRLQVKPYDSLAPSGDRQQFRFPETGSRKLHSQRKP